MQVRGLGQVSVLEVAIHPDHTTIFKMVHSLMESLILAQDERWRRGLGMQVARQAEQSVMERRTGE